MRETTLVSLRMPNDVLRELDRLAEVEQRSRAWMIVVKLRKALFGAERADTSRTVAQKVKVARAVVEKAREVITRQDKVIPENTERIAVMESLCRKCKRELDGKGICRNAQCVFFGRNQEGRTELEKGRNG